MVSDQTISRAVHEAAVEEAYRRGCHQAVGMLHQHLEHSTDARRSEGLRQFADVLRKMRTPGGCSQKRSDHPHLLHEALVWIIS